MEKRIFTFWEPKEKIPGYIELCLVTWHKFLPEYKIVILDYSNLNEWLSKKHFDPILYKVFSLPLQADAIRCALLKKYGGIWMDTDTIITPEINLNSFLNNNAELTIIKPHLAFMAAKPGAKILDIWEKEIFDKITSVKNFYAKFYNPLLFRKKAKSYNAWDYFGSSVYKYFTDNSEYFYGHNREEIKAMPEYSKALETGLKKSLCKNYQSFYFKNDFSDYALDKNKGIILLHNSWTPKKYRQMQKEEFLKQNNTIANIFKNIL